MGSNIMYFLFAGILIVSLIYLTPPWTATNLVIGIVPIVFLLFILIAIMREKRRQKKQIENKDNQTE